MRLAMVRADMAKIRAARRWAGCGGGREVGYVAARFLVIHPNREDLVLNARSAIRNKWSEWEERESVNVIDKKLEDVNGKEFLHFLQGAQ